MIRRLLTAFALVVATCGLSTSPAHAQASKDPIAGSVPPPPPVEGEGDPLYGYLGTAVFAVIVIMAVCKSSRRS